MSSRSSSKSPRLNYYPASLSSPGGGGCCSDSCGSGANGSVIAASIILIILIIFVIVGGIWYWSSSCSKNTKVVRFADAAPGGGELQECPKERLIEIMSGKSPNPVVIAFVAPWCGFCQQMKPALEAAAKECSIPIYTLTHKDGNDHVLAASKHLDVKGYPMLFKIDNGKATPYEGDRSKESIVQFSKS